MDKSGLKIRITEVQKFQLNSKENTSQLISKLMQKNFWLAIFYRKIGPKMTFDFEDPGNPVEMTF